MVVGACAAQTTALEGREGKKEHDAVSEGHCGRSKRNQGERSKR